MPSSSGGRFRLSAEATGRLAKDVLPTTFMLAQNYPNPFNPTTTIKYDLPVDSRVSLKIYDVLGREVMNLVDGPMSAGFHHMTVDGSSLASGVYFYRIDAGLFTQVKKLLLLK